jgi:cytochrome c biogenesis protein ResB
MLVRKKMKKDLITITKDERMTTARKILKEKNIRHLPVVDGKKLIGLVTNMDIRKGEASPATSLEIHELHYLLDNRFAVYHFYQPVIWLLKSFPKFDQQRGGEFILTFEGVASKEYTRLEVTKDPGVWIVWVGSGLMIFGLIVSFFFSHQKVWIRIPKSSGKEIILAGSTNKNRVGFEKTFGQLAEGVRPRSSEFGELS